MIFRGFWTLLRKERGVSRSRTNSAFRRRCSPIMKGGIRECGLDFIVAPRIVERFLRHLLGKTPRTGRRKPHVPEGRTRLEAMAECGPKNNIELHPILYLVF